MIRAFAGIGAGYFLSMIYKDNIGRIKEKVLNIWQKLCLTGVEIYLFLFIFYYTCMHKTNYNNKLIIILGFIGLFSLFVVKKGYFSKLLDNNISVFLGQFAFSIFLTHQFIIKLWNIYICKAHTDWVVSHPVLNIVLLFAAEIPFGILIYYLVEKPCTRYFKNRIKKSI